MQYYKVSIFNLIILLFYRNMPRESRSKSTSVSSERRARESAKNGIHNENTVNTDKQTSQDGIINETVPRSPAVTGAPSTEQQLLSLPGYDQEIVDEALKAAQKAAKEKEKDRQKRSHSKSSSAREAAKSLDIEKILKQQEEILSLFKSKCPQGNQTRTHEEQRVHAVTLPQVQTNQVPVNQDQAAATGGDQGMVTHGDEREEGDQDPGLVGSLNLAFAVDPNAGAEIDSDIAQFIENCINLPNALDWEDMKIIREIYKRPKNCPSLGVPKIPDTLGITMSQMGKDRDKAMSYAQSWVMAGISAMGSIASDLKPFEMDSNVPWARPVYAKSLDMIRILAHLSVNEISKRRKIEVKSFLPAQYKKIANPKPVVPDIQLFGEEVSEDIRVCDEEAKVASKLKSVEYHRGRYQPYRNQRGRARFAGSALSARPYQTNWVNQNQHNQFHGHQQTQDFHQGGQQPAPPQQNQNRPYRGRGRGNRRRGARY